MAKKASGHITYYTNGEGPVVGTFQRKVINEDGLYFKDIDVTGKVSDVNDWRIPAEERAKAYAQTLTVHERNGCLQSRLGCRCQSAPSERGAFEE